MLVLAAACWATACGAAFAQQFEGVGEAESAQTALRVDPEVEALLVRAAQLASRKEYELAATLWQKLLDESGHHLMRADEDRFEPLREQVFRKLAALFPDALRDYRVTADGEARGVLAAAGDDPARREVALAEVVRRFFISSIGDDAAFELAGAALDRRDFVTASRLTRAVLSRHPDPDVPLAPLLVRQAVADAYLGDKKNAEASFERLTRLAPRERASVDLDAVRSYVTQQVLPRRGAGANRAGGEESRHSTSIGRLQPTLPTEVVRGPLTEHLMHSWTVPGGGDAASLGKGAPNRYAAPAMIYLGGSGRAMPYTTFLPGSAATMLYDVGAVGVVESTVIVSEGSFDLTEMVPHLVGPTSSAAVGELTDEERRGALVARWRQRLWQPTPQWLPTADGFVMRSNEDLSCWQVVQGGLKRRWQSAHKNQSLPAAMQWMPWSDAASGGAIVGSDSVLFGDQIALATTVHGDRVYTLEGPRESREPPAAKPAGPQSDGGPAEPAGVDDSGRVLVPAGKPEAPVTRPGDDPFVPAPSVPAPGRADLETAGDGVMVDESGRVVASPGEAPGRVEPQAPSRQRRNFLAAYDQQTGRLVWRRAAEEQASIQRTSDDPETGGDEAGFVGAPTAWNDRLLIPTVSGGTYSILAIQASDGATLWRTPLGDEPDAGTSLRSAGSVAIAGGDAYVVLGSGMVFALDVRSGALHWGARYSRDLVRAAQQPNPWGGSPSPNTATFHGWDSDLAVVSGNQLLVLASDHDQLLALDRRSGAVRWRSPRRLPSGTSVRYALGVAGRRLFVAGTDVVRAYDMPSGRLEWEQPTSPTSARGCVTAQALYLPILGSVDGAVLALDPQTGRELTQAAVTLSTPEPLGNLYSDGQRLWSAGANRVYALTHVPAQLERLAAGVAANRPDDVAHRARLLARLKRFDEALADVRLARNLLAEDDPRAATEVVLDLLLTSKLAHERPLATLTLLAEPLPFGDDQDEADEVRELRLAREQLIRAALGELQRTPAPGGTAELLRLLPDWTRDTQTAAGGAERIVHAAARTLDRCAAAADLPVLREAVVGAERVRRVAALPAFVARADDENLAAVEALLKSDQAAERLAAARALADIKGRRSALTVLVQFLESPTLEVRREALHALRRAAGTAAPPLTLDAHDEGRSAGLALWRTWLAGRTADEPVAPNPAAKYAVLDRILVAVGAPGALIEFDAAGQETWRADDLPSPVACAGTEDGHRLALIHGGRQIVEFDAEGRRIWQSGVLPHPATSVERLADGATLVACPQRDLLFEIAPDGHVLAKQAVRGGPTCTQRLDDRRTLVALSGAGRVVEIARGGQTVWEAAEWPNVTHAQRLPDGRTLLAQTKFNTVGGLTLLDRTGQQTAWQRGGLRSIGGALRGGDGSTVYAAEASLVLLRPDGQPAWTKPIPQVTGIAAH